MRLHVIIAALVGFTGAFCFSSWGKARRLKGAKMTLQNPLEGFSEYRLRDRTRMIMALSEFRKEWQELAEGGSLLRVESPVGLLLADIADKLEMTSQERHVFLGGRLINEVDGLRESRVSRKLSV